MKASLLFYCQHSVGMGHLARSLALVRSLRTAFDVTLVCGGELPPGIPLPEGIATVALPTVKASDPIDQANKVLTTRRATLLMEYARTRPAAVLIELFPFGRKKFANELLPLLKRIRREPAPPLVACSLRDILVAGRRGQAHHDDRAAWLSNRYFDRVLIHADPRLARLEESFAPPRQVLRTPLSYTGYVAPPLSAVCTPRERWILVSAGGGLVGGALFNRVLAAHSLLDPRTRRPLRMVAGPFLPEPEYQSLAARCQEFHDITLLRVVPSLAAEMQCAAASISQCGYNTAMEIAATGTPALVAPYRTATETEQTQRAQRLRDIGVLDSVDLESVSNAELAARIGALTGRTPHAASLDLNGAASTTELLSAWVDANRRERHDDAA